MGSATSSVTATATEKPLSPAEVVDYIATHYILTLDFENLQKLYDKKYCDELVVLTSHILTNSFQSLELEALRNRVHAGAGGTVFFSTQSALNRANAPAGDEKHAICIEISKFYVRIAHVFSAILTSIQPQYQFRNAMGGLERVYIQEKDRIPKGVPVQLVETNFCSKRIDALKNGADATSAGMPTVCDVNEAVQLQNETGIPELELLYLDAGFDANTGEFTEMSEEAKALYASDLKLFYRVFTGKTEVPPQIQKFSQIQLHDFSKAPVCRMSKSERDRVMQSGDNSGGSQVGVLIEKYGNHLREMIRRAEQTRDQLMLVVTALFERTGELVRVHPSLTEKKLQELTRKTRDLIVKMYLTCELDYVEGMRLYEAIVETKMLETSQRQMAHLEEVETNLLTDTGAGTASSPPLTDEQLDTANSYANPSGTTSYMSPSAVFTDSVPSSTPQLEPTLPTLTLTPDTGVSPAFTTATTTPALPSISSSVLVPAK